MNQALPAPPPCPACGTPTHPFRGDSGATLDVCIGCHGTWLPAGALAREVQTATDLPELARSRQAAQASAVACPACPATPLTTLPYWPGDALQIDWCPGCQGVWLAKGKASAVKRLVASHHLRVVHAGARPGPSAAAASGLGAALPAAPAGAAPRLFDAAAPALVTALAHDPCLYIEQTASLIKLLVDWQPADSFTVYDAHRRVLGALVEERGLGAALRRQSAHLRRRFHLIDNQGRALLTIERPFSWMFPDLELTAPDGRLIGHVRSRFGLMRTLIDLHDEHGRCFARIIKPMLSFSMIWKYPVYRADGRQVALIQRLWGGALREIFTDAANFRVAFTAPDLPLTHRAVIFAASVLIDLKFFERHGQSGAAGLVDPALGDVASVVGDLLG